MSLLYKAESETWCLVDVNQEIQEMTSLESMVDHLFIGFCGKSASDLLNPTVGFNTYLLGLKSTSDKLNSLIETLKHSNEFKQAHDITPLRCKYVTDEKSWNLAIFAAQRNDYETIDKLRLKNVNLLNQENKYGKTALFYAVQHDTPETINALIHAKVDLNHENKYGKTAFFYAVQYGTPEVINVLIHAKVDLNHKDKYGKTALFYAVQHGTSEIINALIHAKVDLSYEDHDGRTAVFYAVTLGSMEMMKAFIQAKVDLNHEDNDGRTILFYAVQYGNLELINALIQEDIVINLADNFGKTPAFYAAKQGKVELIDLLYQKDGLIMPGETAAHQAIKEKNFQVMYALFKADKNRYFNTTIPNKVDAETYVKEQGYDAKRLFSIMKCFSILEQKNAEHGPERKNDKKTYEALNYFLKEMEQFCEQYINNKLSTQEWISKSQKSIMITLKLLSSQSGVTGLFKGLLSTITSACLYGSGYQKTMFSSEAQPIEILNNMANKLGRSI